MVSNLKELYKKLNILDKDEFSYLIDIDYNSSNNFSLRYKNALMEMKPEAIFCLENEPFILFFNLETSTEVEKELNRIHKQSWNFDKAPIIVVSTSNEIVFYNAFDFDAETCKLEKLTNYEEDFETFSYENLYSGNLFDLFQNKFVDSKRVNKLLLEHITTYRQQLTEEIDCPSFANKILSRIIFLRYLQDRKISVDKSNTEKIKESFHNQKTLYKLFKDLKKDFNGDLFEIDENEENKITDAYMEILQGFFNNVSIHGQIRLFPFDFSIIPIELISNIYEKFLTDKRDENKSYYTPTFLVDYMINKTITPFLDKKNKQDSDCKVLDPACGSGIFLIEALRKIIQKEEQLNKGQKLTPERLKILIEKNVFGIDKDEDAINIAIFSLYITLLDYQDPKSILSFKFPKLKESNFFVSDFFNCENSFNTQLRDIDFILSNPPYGSIKEGDHINWCKREDIPINDNQIAQSFLARAKDFSSINTKISMLVTSKILYNLNGIKFRQYFLKTAKINEVFELSAVRNLLFHNAIPPTCILSYQYLQNDNLNNNFKHISIKPNLFFKYFRIIMIEKNDEKVVKQSFIYKFDWLWKVLLYGNILDFYFIKRLFETYPSLNKMQDNVISGEGIQIGGGDKQSTEYLTGLPFLDTKKKQLKCFYANIDASCAFDVKYVHRNRYGNKEIFQAPALLIKKGNAKDFSCVSAVTNDNLVFTHSVSAIKFKDNDLDKLYSLCGILNSNLFTYFILNIGSSVAVERNQIHLSEYLKTPFNYSEELAKIVCLLHKFHYYMEPSLFEKKHKYCSDYKQLSYLNYDMNEYLLPENHPSTLSTLNEMMNKKINNLFELNEAEEDLIDYSLNISIPVWQYGDDSCKINCCKPFQNVSEEQLIEYSKVFCENFAEQYKYFNVDVYSFEKCTLINFKVREKSPSKPIIKFITNSSLKDSIGIVTKLSLEKITSEIFIKKDIKGFQENSFFVLKTNEYKNWHKAIARLDVNEFSNAIWEAEIELSK